MLRKKTYKKKGKGLSDNINEKLDTIIKLLNEISQKLPNRMIPGEAIQQSSF